MSNWRDVLAKHKSWRDSGDEDSDGNMSDGYVDFELLERELETAIEGGDD